MPGTSAGIPDFSIIGAGIMGLCLARELHAAGARVAVYERAPASPEQLPVLAAAAGTAAWAAAGMLGPSGFPPHTPLHSFARAAAEYYPDFAASLERETGIHCDYRRIGTLASRHGLGGAHAAACAEASGISDEDEPHLAHAHDYVLIAGDHAVDNRKLVQALWKYAHKNKITMMTGCEAGELRRTPDHAIRIQTANGCFTARQAILAAGAWSGQFAGIHVPVVPRKGQLLCVQAPADLIRHVILGPKVYLVPRSDGRIMIGASLEDAGFDARLNPEIAAQLLKAAVGMVPAMKDFPAESWCGFRPYSETGLPQLGPTNIPGVWAATGLFRDGILLAPIAARELAAVLTERKSELLSSLNLNAGAAPERRRECSEYRFQ